MLLDTYGEHLQLRATTQPAPFYSGVYHGKASAKGYESREVRFTVYVKDGKAALKATPVKDGA